MRVETPPRERAALVISWGWVLSMQAGLVFRHGMAAQTSRDTVWLLRHQLGSHSVTHVMAATSLGVEHKKGDTHEVWGVPTPLS